MEERAPSPVSIFWFSAQEAKLAENACTLADLTEGQVGKLPIHKSKRVQPLLGKVTLDVTMGTACSFLQERVSVGLGGRTRETCEAQTCVFPQF